MKDLRNLIGVKKGMSVLAFLSFIKGFFSGGGVCRVY